MSAGKLAFRHKATGKILRLEERRRHKFDIKIYSYTSVKHYAVPFKMGTEPPDGPPVGATPEEVDGFFDAIIGRFIAECEQQALPPLIQNDPVSDSDINTLFTISQDIEVPPGQDGLSGSV